MCSERAAPAFELAGVEFAYGRAPVLRGLSLSVAAGECAGLLGPNGSGKSTILRLLSGALQPQAGQVLIGGRPRGASDQRALARRIALVPQGLEVTFDFQVQELVLLGRSPYIHWLRGDTAADRRIAERALAAVGAAALAGRSFRELSGGERQRVVLAMALAQEPEILLLDEPTHNLDIASQTALFDLVQGLNRERGLTVFSAIHSVNLAALYCERLILLREGEVLVDGPPAAVVTEAHLHRAYGATVRVAPHPLSGRPQMVLVPGSAALPTTPV